MMVIAATVELSGASSTRDFRFVQIVYYTLRLTVSPFNRRTLPCKTLVKEVYFRLSTIDEAEI